MRSTAWVTLLVCSLVPVFRRRRPSRRCISSCLRSRAARPDVRARQIAAKLGESLGQPVIVDNRPGGNGLIGAQQAVKSAPDGYTMFLALINNAIADAANPNPCCRLNQELVPVTRLR